MGDSTTITIRVDRAVKERLENVARQTKRSKSDLAGEAIEEFLTVHEWQVEGIERALRSLDAGKGVSHDEVSSWICSWDTDNERPKPKA